MSRLDVPLVTELPRRSVARVMRRYQALGVRFRRWSGSGQPPGIFHHGGGAGPIGGNVGGVVWWDPRRANIDLLTHEAAHLVMMGPERRTFPGGDTCKHGRRHDEYAVMALQCEVVRGLPGMGVDRALRWMVDIGYSFYDGESGTELSARHWWRNAAEERQAAVALLGAGRAR